MLRVKVKRSLFLQIDVTEVQVAQMSKTCTSAQCKGVALGVGRCEACVRERYYPSEMEKRVRNSSGIPSWVINGARKCQVKAYDAGVLHNTVASLSIPLIPISPSKPTKPVLQPPGSKCKRKATTCKVACNASVPPNAPLKHQKVDAEEQSAVETAAAATAAVLADAAAAAVLAAAAAAAVLAAAAAAAALAAAAAGDEAARADDAAGVKAAADPANGGATTDSAAAAAGSSVAPPSIPVAKAASKAKRAYQPKANARPVSKRLDDDGVPLSFKALCAIVARYNSLLPKQFQLKDLKNKSMEELETILDNKDQSIASANLHTLMEGARMRLTAAVNRDVCIRMLTLLAKKPALLALYQANLQAPNRLQKDASKQHAGQGLGLNHAYHVAMCEAFNDTSFLDDFPFEYVPESTPMHSNGITEVQAPIKIELGLFAGMQIKQAGIPDNFPPNFFSKELLDKIFQGGISEFHNMQAKRHSSGQHGEPLWFFVSPYRTKLAEEMEMYLDVVGKRWDSLAFHCMFSSIEELKLFFIKVIPGGKGGPPSAAAPRALDGAAPKNVLQHQRLQQQQHADEQLRMQREMHDLKMLEMKGKAEATAGNQTVHIMKRIADLLQLQKQFQEFGTQSDLVTVTAQEITALKMMLVPVLVSCKASVSSSASDTPTQARDRFPSPSPTLSVVPTTLDYS